MRTLGNCQVTVGCRLMEAREDDVADGEGDDGAKTFGANVMNYLCVWVANAGWCNGAGGFTAPC